METLIKIFIVWYFIGVAGFVFWFSKEHKFNLKSFKFMLYAGFYGVFAWIVGYLIHGKK